jgi:hypothetical protein
MKKSFGLLVVASSLLLAACGGNAASSFTSNSSSLAPDSSNEGTTSSESSSESIVKYYTVNFYGDNDALLASEQVAEGENATEPDISTPGKDPDERYVYKFTGWDKSLTNIVADTDIHAVFAVDHELAYFVKFVDYDDTLLYSSYYNVGETPFYYSDTHSVPCREATSTTYYTFSAWDHEITAVSDHDETYKATYTETAYSFSYSFDTDHYIVTGVSAKHATGYTIPDTYDDGTNGEHPVTTIAAKAFDSIVPTLYCFLHLGKNVTSIADDAFNVVWFSSISVSAGSIFHTSDDHHVLYKDNKVVLFGTYNVPVICNDYSIPSGATSIGAYAFYWMTYLSTLTLPDTMFSLGQCAFVACQLTSLSLGNSLTTIGEQALFANHALKTLTLPKSLASIGKMGLSSCEKLATLNYEGTMADWAKVSLGTNWHLDSAFTAVTCSDGTVTL